MEIKGRTFTPIRMSNEEMIDALYRSVSAVLNSMEIRDRYAGNEDAVLWQDLRVQLEAFRSHWHYLA